MLDKSAKDKHNDLMNMINITEQSEGKNTPSLEATNAAGAPGRIEIVASLEGARVVIEGWRCELDEYDFSGNFWQNLETAELPLSTVDADRWLRGWNPVDRLKARALLIRRPPAMTISSQLGKCVCEFRHPQV